MSSRLVTVVPPSARAEAWMVARALFHVAYWSVLLVSAQTYDPRAAGAAPMSSSPFEQSFQTLPSDDQRMFRSIHEGLLEAERVRASTGRWPDVEALARDGVPPFARDPIDHAGYVWRVARSGVKVAYIGVPRVNGRDTFCLLILEPEPGTPDDPLALPDEVHHRLDGGPMIHAMVWKGPPLGPTDEPFASIVPERGYRQIVGTAPAAAGSAP